MNAHQCPVKCPVDDSNCTMLIHRCSGLTCAWTAWLLLPHKASRRCFPPFSPETIPSVTWTRRISPTHTTRCSCWRARGSGGWWAAEIADWCLAETWSSSGSTSVTFTAALWEPRAEDEADLRSGGGRLNLYEHRLHKSGIH